MTKSDIYKIIEKCKNNGYSITQKDIGCMLLKKELNDMVLAHQIVFNSNSDFTIPAKYEAQQKIVYLKKILNEFYTNNDSKLSEQKALSEKDAIKDKIKARKIAKKDNSEDLTFEENKAAMIQMIAQIESEMEGGYIEPKDGLKMITDIRIKLVDKFNTSEEVDRNYIIVNTKMNSICECGREFYNPMEDPEFMKYYNKDEK